MIDTPTRTRGDQTRERCLQGAQGLLAKLNRTLNATVQAKESFSISIDLNSVAGVINAVVSKSKRAIAIESGRHPDDVLSEIFDQLADLALPDSYRTIRIDIVSVSGTLSAESTEITRHRWDV